MSEILDGITLIESRCDTDGPCYGNPEHGSGECYPAYRNLSDEPGGHLMDYREWQLVVSSPVRADGRLELLKHYPGPQS
jgi:hypothetical protein